MTSELYVQKKDDDVYESAFESLDKGQVIQNVRMFSATKLRAGECYYLLCQILYLITCKSQGFTRQEATNIFFAVTKLFQSKDAALRRMMYLLLKELSPLADDTIIAFAILIKDVNSDVPMYQANAIRVVSGIMDNSMLSQMERYLKQAIVARDAYVASSALVSSYHLFERGCHDIIRRWLDGVQEVLRTGGGMAQYHALGLLQAMKQNDRMAVTKLVQACASGSSLRSVHAHLLLIRYTIDLLATGRQRDPLLWRYLETSLRHKSDIVTYEAVRGFLRLPDLTESDLAGPVSVLQNFLSSARTTQRYAGAKTLSQIANRYPAAIGSRCAYALEALISDPSRSVASLAITTLLKIESEDRVEHLMRQIGTFVSEIADDFRIVVVEAVRMLSIKFPNKHRAVMEFLSKLLRDQTGGLEFKRAVVSTILSVVERVPEAKNSGLESLCEFIEDCDYPELSKQILHLLGTEGPLTAHPTRFIRSIYNRIILEAPEVRAAAVSALASFGQHVIELRPQIRVLLKRSLLDPDNEVRDRATLFLSMLEDTLEQTEEPAEKAPMRRGKLIVEPLEVPLENLEAALVGYLASAPSEVPFHLASVPKQVAKRAPASGSAGKLKNALSPTPTTDHTEDANAALAKRLGRLQELFGVYGRLLNSTNPLSLTEAETAYQITVIKHIFATHIVLEYNVVNTLPDQVLKNISVELRADNVTSSLTIEKIIPAQEAVDGGESAQVFVVLRRGDESEELNVPRQLYSHVLVFTAHEVNTQIDEDGIPDEFPLDDFRIALGDFIRAHSAMQFHERWNELGAEQEAVAAFVLRSVSTLKDAIEAVTQSLGLAPVDHSNEIDERKTRHVLYLSGVFTGEGTPSIVAQVKMMYPKDAQGVAIQIAARSSNIILAKALSQGILTA